MGEVLEKGAAKAARCDEEGRVGSRGDLTMSSIASQADIEKHALALAEMSAFGSLRE